MIKTTLLLFWGELPEGRFLLAGIFRAEWNFLLFKDQLAESGCQKTKEITAPRGKFRPVENSRFSALKLKECIIIFAF